MNLSVVSQAPRVPDVRVSSDALLIVFPLAHFFTVWLLCTEPLCPTGAIIPRAAELKLNRVFPGRV